MWVCLTPILLFIVLMLLLYVPPVQRVIKGGVESYVSEATGLNVSIGRLDLRFPLNLLVHDVLVVKPASDSLQPDTLLDVESLNVRVQARPLFKGQLEVDGIHLTNAKVNTSDLIDGVWIKGSLADFNLKSHGNDLEAKRVFINDVSLTDADVLVQLLESTEPDTTTTDLDWLIEVQDATLERVKVNFGIPADTLSILAKIKAAKAQDARIDLGEQYYGIQSFFLDDSYVKYEANLDTVSVGFDPNHITLHNLHAQIDSAYYQGKNMQGIVRELRFDERSGVSVTSLTAHLSADEEKILLPDLAVTTPHSTLTFEGELPWTVLEDPSTGIMDAQILARLGREDLMLVAGNLPDSFKKSYPDRPLSFRGKARGNFQQLSLRDFSAQLPGSFSLTGEGDFYQITDSLQRRGNMKLSAQTGNLNFLTSLMGTKPDSTFVIPNNIALLADVHLDKNRVGAKINATERQGKALIDATYDLVTEAYTANLTIDSLQINHFLPYDSIFNLTATMQASGKGLDFMGRDATAKIQGTLQNLHYKNWQINNVILDGTLQRQLANVNFTSDNPLLKAVGTGQIRLGSQYTE